MRRILLALLLSWGLSCAACNGMGLAPSRALGQNGPSTSEDCTVPEANAVPTMTPTVERATASGGQTASNQPNQADPGARGIHNTMDRGGTATDSSSTSETRSQAGAPSVNQGYVIPTTAEVGHGGSSLATQKAAQTIDTLNAALIQAFAAGKDVSPILAALKDAQKDLSAAAVNDKSNVTYNINVSGSPQTVENKSRSGGEGSDSGSVAKDAAARALGGQPTPAVPAPEQPGMQ